MTSHSGSAGYKRPQSSSSGPGIGGVAAGGEDGAKKKKKGNWRNRYGPCFTTDVKPSEASPSLSLHTSSTANTCSSTASPSCASSTLPSRPGLVSSSGLGVGLGGGAGERGLGVMGVCGGIQKSPSLLRNGSLQSSSGPTATGLGETAVMHDNHSGLREPHKETHLSVALSCIHQSKCMSLITRIHSNIGLHKEEKRGLA